MKQRRPFVAPALTVAGLMLLAAAPYPAMSQAAAPTYAAETDHSTARHQHRAARLQARLTRMAERLEITPAQQDAWAAYAATVESLMPAQRAKPPADADPAALIRFRAERTAAHAQRLTQLADATEALQQVLSPEQQQTLKKMMRRKGHGTHGHKHTG